jgi:uncharacterized membrane protein YcaP (DUF421 family)
MFHMPLSIMEKILRPVIVYLALIVLLRIFGKRELAQLNPFDLVVLLSLSNTVQNAIIGDDNSVSGGLIGALALLAINWGVSKATYRAPKLTAALEGSATTLIRDGKVIEDALKKESLSMEDLLSALHKNNFNDPAEVKQCVLEPNGTFYVQGITPNEETVDRHELMDAVKALAEDVRKLREEVRAAGRA